MLNALFINVTIFVSFLFVYHLLSIWMEGLKNRLFRLVTIGLYFGGVGIGLMFYAFPLSNGGLVDLRHLVPIITTIYFGPLSGVISAIIIVIGRVTLFPFQLFSIAESIILLSIVVLNISTFYTYTKRMSMFIVMNIVSTIVYFVSFHHFLGSGYETYVSYSLHALTTFIGGFFVFFVAEYMHRTKKIFRELLIESRTDYLTKLNNVREFDFVFDELINKAQNLKKPLSLILLDIDHFKKVNDTYGHSVGDQVLKELGRLLQTNSRQGDVISRNGGEEFSIIMFDSPQQEALIVAERIRKCIQDYSFAVKGSFSINITVSMGVATFPDTFSLPDPIGIYDQADEALYEAKRSGRNQVMMINE